ncbi:MAG TPA: thioredoxin domain-containing protein [Clostridiales bacterium]|nr:thioredoxin domain-containing protein [Clostridiales bacterium]
MPVTAKSSDQPNRLIKEKSPYLLQHAYNPVDWYPWGEEAFDKARTENKPIFLSIGYSTCHWCHVMERESFEDEEVADALNNNFISIKVDREERPDIDHIYMSVCQALTGQGGWPLTIFMTADNKPFYAGTYLPKTSRYGRIGFLELLDRIHEMWLEQQDEVNDSAERILSAVKEAFLSDAEQGESGILPETVHDAYEQFKYTFDRSYGGFGSAPKFPSPHNLLFLMRYWFRYGNEVSLDMAVETLKAIYKGGIHDHIGFGFSRYSVDNKWLVPHFEKMLYDNALLATAYLECYQITGLPLMSKAAEEIFEYVLREMTSPEGGFYSAEDADSEGVEGKYYVWTPDEVISVLGEEKGREFCLAYDITEQGNFEGKSIPNLVNASDEDIDNAHQLYEERIKLLEARDERSHPHKDDKILTSWNGMMIAALAMGGRILKDSSYLEAAEKAWHFIIEQLQREDGRLLARYRDGEAAIPGYADDYAFLIWAGIELFETTGRAEYLEKAIELNDGLMKLFWDEEKGGLFLYGTDSEQLIYRPKEIYDGATPSANSQTVWNWLKLSGIIGNQEYADRADQILTAFGDSIVNQPRGSCHALSGAMYASESNREVVIVGREEDKEFQDMVKAAQSNYYPFSVTILCKEGDERRKLELLIPDIGDKGMLMGKATAYVCVDFACREPVTSAVELSRQLEEFRHQL